ncbi:30S ribosomal protein S6 [Patescibacteria group bacterium]|nr:30S ribosomal protein S6 [Patescibacteria group bacterium]
MSKTKKTGAGHYEILFIVPNKFTEDEAKKIATKVETMIVEAEGKVTFSEFWGKKKLAYKIKNNEYGYYGLFEFDLEKELLAKIENDLRLSTEILRHQIVVKKTKTEAELKREEEIRAKIDSKKAKEVKAEKTEVKKNFKEEKADKTTSAKKAVAPKSADLKELDEKLEGILNADDLI